MLGGAQRRLLSRIGQGCAVLRPGCHRPLASTSIQLPVVRELFVVRPALRPAGPTCTVALLKRGTRCKSLRALVAEAYRYADHEVRAIPHHNDDR